MIRLLIRRARRALIRRQLRRIAARPRPQYPPITDDEY